MLRALFPSPLVRASLALAVPLLLALPAAAFAVPIAGTVDDRGGDAHNGAQDIRTAGVGYDASGVVNAVVVTAAPALDPQVSDVEVSVGAASKRQGLCRLKFHADMLTAKPTDPDGPFASLYIDNHKLRFQVVSQNANTLAFNTIDGDDLGSAPGPMPVISGEPWNCALVRTFGPRAHNHGKGEYVTDDATRVFPLMPGSAPTPYCRVPTRKAHRGRRIRVACRHVAGRITVRFHRHQRLKRARHATIRHGHARVTTRGLRRGWNDISIWVGDAMVGNGSVRLRGR